MHSLKSTAILTNLHKYEIQRVSKAKASALKIKLRKARETPQQQNQMFDI